MSEPVIEKKSAVQKQPYMSPKLIVYGDIKTLTTGGHSVIGETAVVAPSGSLWLIN